MELCKTFRQVTMTNTPVLVVAGNYNLVGWNLINPVNARAYLKLCNAATAGAVTPGTTAVVKTLDIPSSGTAVLSNELMLQDAFPLGIVAYVSTGLDDSDNTAPSTGCYVELKYLANQ